MAGDFNKPTNTDGYTDVLAAVRDLCADLAKMLDGTGTSNIPSGSIRWSSSNSRFEVYDGTSWGVLTEKMLMNVDKIDGYDAGNASGNVPVSNGTRCVELNADKLDGLHASALFQVANNFSELIDQVSARANLGLGTVATENTVPLTKGGTGSTTASGARTSLGLVYDVDILTPTGSAAQLQDLPTEVADIITTRGDLVVGDADGKPARLSRGTDGQVLGWNSTGDCLPVDLPESPGDYLTWNFAEYTTVGSDTFVVPAGVTQVVVECCGGGGGSGGTGDTIGKKSSRAGGPGALISCLVSVSPGASVPVVVGGGGTRGSTYGGTGGTGGSSSFGSLVTAAGGPGGAGSTDSSGYTGQGHATTAVSGVLIITNNMIVNGDNNGPACMTRTTGYRQNGKLFGGGASGVNNDGIKTGNSGASGYVRIWYK